MGPQSIFVLEAEKAIAACLSSSVASAEVPAEVLVSAALLRMDEGDSTWRGEVAVHWKEAPAAVFAALGSLASRLRDSLPPASIRELVPYLMEPVAGGYRLPTVPGSHGDKSARQELATYFTPGDIAAFMTREGLVRLKGEPSGVLDPCCGTGTFLRHFVRETRASMCPEAQLHAFAGFDLDARSLNIAAVILSAEIFGRTSDWRRVRQRLHHGDALDLIRRAEHRHAYRLLLANPPYGASSTSPDRAADFAGLLVDALAMDGVGVMIVPASLTTSRTGAQARARRRLLGVQSTWTFLNYDRSPDSLFGDDVKQRCTIVVRESKGSHEVITSEMLRWRRPARGKALSARETVKLSNPATRGLVPRVASRAELEVFDALLTAPRGDCKSRRTLDLGASLETQVVVGEVAYNFVPAWTGNASSQSFRGRRSYDMVHRSQALALYAVLVSRFGFWFWRAFDDGFHVSVEYVMRLAGFVQHLDSATVDALASAGLALGDRAKSNIVRSLNAGREGATPVPPNDAPEMSDVENTILSVLGLPSRTVEQFLLRLGAVHEVTGTEPTNKGLQ